MARLATQGTGTGGGNAGGAGNLSGAGGGVSQAVARHIQNELAVVRADLMAEVAKLDASISNAEAQRRIDYKTLSDGLKDVPSTRKIRVIVWQGIAGLIAFLALIWTILGVGADIPGAFAEKLLARSANENDIKKQLGENNRLLSQVLKEQQHDNAQGSPQPGQAQQVHQGTPKVP